MASISPVGARVSRVAAPPPVRRVTHDDVPRDEPEPAPSRPAVTPATTAAPGPDPARQAPALRDGPGVDAAYAEQRYAAALREATTAALAARCAPRL